MPRAELDLLASDDAIALDAGRLDAQRYLGFVVGGEQLALPIGAVREVARVPPITEVPRAPRDVRGVVALHGRIVTVVDLRRRLGLPDPPPGAGARLLLVPSGEEDLALLVDAVTRLHRVAPSEVELAATMAGTPRAHVVGVARVALDRDAPPTLVVLADPAVLARSA